MFLGGVSIQITERDIHIISAITKFRFLLSRQIRILCDFSGQRACDRRLHILIENGFIERKKYLYGVPSLYFATPKAKKTFHMDYISTSVRLEQIRHDILVVDTVMFIMAKCNIPLDALTSERDLKHSLGFGNNRHTPDLVFPYRDKNYCVEVELSLKQLTTLEKNVHDNFLNYHEQLWVLDYDNQKLMQSLEQLKKSYGFKTLNVIEVSNYAKTL